MIFIFQNHRRQNVCAAVKEMTVFGLFLALLHAMGCSDLALDVRQNNNIVYGQQTNFLNKRLIAQLGFGVNASGTRLYSNCIDYAQPDMFNSGFQVSTTAAALIHSHQDLAKLAGLSNHLQVQYLWGNENSGFSQLMDSTISDKSIHWLVWGRYELQPQLISWSNPQFRLSEQAFRLLNNPKLPLQKFFDVCGTHFYSGYIKGGMFVALYQIQTSNQEVINRVKKSLPTETTSILKGSEEFENHIEEAIKHDAFSLKIAVLGGDYQIVEDLNRYNLSSKELRIAISRLQESILKRGTGAVLEWFETAYEDAFSEEFAQARELRKKSNHLEEKLAPWDDFKNDLLGQLFNHYQNNKSMLYDARIQHEVLSDEIYDPIQQQNDLNVLQKTMEELERQNTDIATLAKACLESNDTICNGFGNSLNYKKIIVPNFSNRLNDDLLNDWYLALGDTEDALASPEFYKLKLRGEYYHDHQVDFCTFYGGADIVQLKSSDLIALNVSFANQPNKLYVIGVNDYLPVNKDAKIFRPKLCVEDFAKNCRMQMRPAKYSQPSKIKGQNFSLIFKLFDDFGYLEKTIVNDTACRVF